MFSSLSLCAFPRILRCRCNRTYKRLVQLSSSLFLFLSLSLSSCKRLVAQRTLVFARSFVLVLARELDKRKRERERDSHLDIFYALHVVILILSTHLSCERSSSQARNKSFERVELIARPYQHFGNWRSGNGDAISFYI